MTRIRGIKGEKLEYGGVTMTVRNAIDLNTLMLVCPEGEIHYATVSDLEKEAKGIPKANVIHDEIRLQKVDAWVQGCKHLMDDERHAKADAERAAKTLGVSAATIYRALERWRLSGDVNDLPPPTRNGGRGKSRIRPKVEEIIQDQIDEFLRKGGKTKRKFYRDTKQALSKAGLEVSQTTLRERLANIPAYKMTKRRRGRGVAQRELDPIKGSYPDLTRPLQAVQIDHWKIDAEIVSDDRTRSIGRAWATIAICIWSRTVFGMNVGLDDPGNVPFGMMMINGLLGKDRVADEFGIEWDNPVRGRPETIEMDNAKEFTGKMAQAGCDRMNIRLKIRPVTKPQYGQYIERLNGTLATRFKDVPGATGSNTREKEREGKAPSVTAALTLSELTELMWRKVDEYQNEVHTGIGMTPLEKFKSYYFGPHGQRHRLPEVFVDDLDLRTKWYPLVHRSMQRYGIRIDHLEYYSESIEWLVQNREDFGKIEVRRNPFDVRVVYIRHPAPTKETDDGQLTEREGDWIPVNVRQMNFPEASIYELREAKRAALARKREPTPEVLASIIDDQQTLIDSAVAKTKKAQRDAARREANKKANQKAKKAEEASKRPHNTERATAQPDEPIPTKRPNKLSGDDGISDILAGITFEDLEEFVDG